jgi:hypothetical protein
MRMTEELMYQDHCWTEVLDEIFGILVTLNNRLFSLLHLLKVHQRSRCKLIKDLILLVVTGNLRDVIDNSLRLIL